MGNRQMLEIARQPEVERRNLFRAVAEQMRVHEAIIEKDFWVCWILDYLFQDSPWKELLSFKGGTSLSKAYKAINRFSEDIDLILHWQLLGLSGEEVMQERSATKQDSFCKRANLRAEEFLNVEFVPRMEFDLGARTNEPFRVIADMQCVHITYPRTFSRDGLLPHIQLEMGPLSAWVPNEQRAIRSYAAEYFPHLFSRPVTEVRTISAERTFWEKATILHQEYHRQQDRKMPIRHSRHYYDLYRLSRSPIRNLAIHNLGLLEEVARFKMKFYRSPWAKYEEAWPGTLHLSPSVNRHDELRNDYQAMQAMLFGTVPTLDEIITELRSLEAEINLLKSLRI